MRSTPLLSDAKPLEAFAALADPEAGTIVWPNGADIAPGSLYERATTAVKRRGRSAARSA